ncbi:hypothetical protein [Chitinophaga barathri]|nr:hypothetical protein [Chitinophaga barathri]
MKRVSISILVLCSAIITASAFRTKQIIPVGTLFQLTDISQPFNPAVYQVATIDPITDCPNSSAICVIDVPLSDVYPSGPNAGKPKVDIATAVPNELSDDIVVALGNASDPTSFPARQRIIYEKQP